MSAPRPSSAAAGNVLLAVGSIAFALLLVGALEGALRLAGLGAADASGASRLKYQQVFPPMLEPAVHPDGTPVWQTADPRLPYQAIPRRKAPGSLRIFTFGGSATAGLGFSPNVTFGRYLAQMLDQAYPDRTIEVVNLGIVALSSKQVKVLVEDACRHYEPDLVIVYSGNNEFLEIHAEKYAEAHAGALESIKTQLMETNLYRLVNGAVRGGPRAPSLAGRDLSHDDLRLSQNAIIRDIEMRPDEIDEIVAGYRANLAAMAEVANETGTPLVLATVASNWKWRGREDLPGDWLDTLLGEAGAPTPERHRRAIARIEELLPEASPEERWALRFQRAVAYESLGDFPRAREEYRAAMNEDPHLRRALDRMADAVRAVGREHGVHVVDTIAYLSRRAEHRIVGFDEFYDYVHFTPRGALLVAAALFEALPETGVAAPAPSFDAEDWVAKRVAQLRTLREDALAVGEWLGVGSDPQRIADRDLWKYDHLLEQLDARIAADPRDFRALVYRGNAYSHRHDGGERAARDYRAALEIEEGHPAVRANLDGLRRAGRAGETSP